jgi:hypothetical protein
MSCGHESLAAARSAALAKLWECLQQEFDLIIVAAGPLHTRFAGEFSSLPSTAELFLPLADGAILNIELGGTPAAAGILAKRILSESGVNLIGCVVRGVFAT